MPGTATITPHDIGLPDAFPAWRPGQWASIETSITTEKRFVAQSAPTGFGKSVFSIATALLSGGRSVYLTSTKALQEQLRADFQECNMNDMRGRQNYLCVKGRRLSCTEGRILECRDPGCPYTADRTQFLQSNLGLTNYSYYFSSIIHSEGCGEISLLIADEAHSAVSELCSAIEIRLNNRVNRHLFESTGSFPPFGTSLAQWRTWAKFAVPKAQAFLREAKSSGEGKWLNLADQYVSTLQRIAGVSEDWILDENNPDETLISPLWPTQYADMYFFQKIPHVMLVSATLVPKTLALLNIKEEDSLFLSQDHTFDPNRCPVYLFGPCRVDHKMSQGQFEEVIGRMDTFIGRRLDRKGIIHCVSYANQEKIWHASQHRDIMLAPRNPREFQEMLAEFRVSGPPKILISPAATTGYDFPGSQCEYQVIYKVPFIDARSPVMAARAKADPEYLPYLVAQTLVQTCGRGMRAEKDQCENLLLDAHANWFLGKQERGGYRHLVPPWFMRQVRWPDGQPVPPPPLNRSTQNG